MSRTIWQEAASLAARVHEYQYRRDGQTPYAAHPTRVALTVACVFGVADPNIIAAALLHDAIEDCGVDYDEIAGSFGSEIAQFVAAMSKDMRLPEPQREVAYDEQLARGPWQGRLLKLADVYDNLCDAEGDGARRSQLARVRRALDLAAGDPQLGEPCRIVRELMARIEEEMGGCE